MISSGADLARLLTAIFQGRLVPPGELGEMFTLPDVPYTGSSGNCHVGPNAGRACYSINPTGDVDGSETPYVVRIAAAAFDPDLA